MYGQESDSQLVAAEACPNCETPRSAFRKVHRSAPSDDNRTKHDIEAARAKLDTKLGALTQCSTCGYQCREHDELKPAEA